jgi:hypothetical protein
VRERSRPLGAGRGEAPPQAGRGRPAGGWSPDAPSAPGGRRRARPQARLHCLPVDARIVGLRGPIGPMVGRRTHAHLNLTAIAFLPLIRTALAEGPRWRRCTGQVPVDPTGWMPWRTAGPLVRIRVRTAAHRPHRRGAAGQLSHLRLLQRNSSMSSPGPTDVLSTW